MCILCKAGMLRRHFGQTPGVGLRSTRRGFMAGAVAAGATTAASLSLFAPRPTTAQVGMPPQGTGTPGRRYVIKGGAVMTMDGGEFIQADVVVERKKIVAVQPGAGAGGEVIDATGKIVMPGFIDTHHQFETALRGFLADGALINDGDSAGGSLGEGNYAYFEQILLGFAPFYRPTRCASPPSMAPRGCGSTTGRARSRSARRQTSSSSTPPASTLRRSTTCRGRWFR
jgi:5-methylthioadenosine/S-adenosylhomocysteine deaminase